MVARRTTRRLITIDGFECDPADAVLLIRTPTQRLTFDLRLPGAGELLEGQLGEAIRHRLASEVPARVYGDLLAIRSLVEASSMANGEQVTALTLGDVCASRAAMAETKPAAYNHLVYALRRMVPLLGSAVEPSLRSELAVIRPIKRKRRPGNTRSSRDRCGPLSVEEFAALAERLAAKLAAGEITVEDHALAVLEATLYPRPAQIALLKARDLVRVGSSDGQPQYELRIPRIKQRGKLGASSFRSRKLGLGLASVLLGQCGRAVREVAGDGIGAELAPIFPRGAATSVLGTDFPELESHRRHSTAGDIQDRISNVLGVNSRCARRTVATRMRAGNRSYRQIGLVLDNDPASARIYVDDTPEMIARVTAKMGASLACLADLFLGRPGGRVLSLWPGESRP